METEVVDDAALASLVDDMARHRPIVVIVGHPDAVAPDTTWMRDRLPGLLHDPEVRWVRLRPAGASGSDGEDRGAVSSPRPVRPRFGWASLTDAEVTVVRLVADGHTNRSAAAALSVSVNTVSTHLRSAYNKLDVHSRVQLTRVVMEQGHSTSVATGSPTSTM